MSRHSAGRDQGAMPWAPQGGLIRRTIETGARLLGVGASAGPPRRRTAPPMPAAPAHGCRRAAASARAIAASGPTGSGATA